MGVMVAPGAFTYGIVSASNGGVSSANNELADALAQYIAKPIAKASIETIADFIQHSQPHILHSLLGLGEE